MKFEVDAGTMSEINVTPFTDVLLVLLIVFMMLAALVAPPGFQRHFPCACSHRPAAPAQQPLEVTVDARGNIRLGGRATDADRLYGDLRHGLAAAKTRSIALDAAIKAPYGAVLRVLDAAKAAGNADVTLVT
ncbi:MAG TPA: biopolymer transporter ExbD, partial [Candidatus Baltobacteraceae bacterium]|nr:biopolymer transporter ExbD [Candidatus Baltobacteraceae bacterium]